MNELLKKQIKKFLPSIPGELKSLFEEISKTYDQLNLITFTSEQLLKAPSWDANIQKVLEKVGETLNVSRVHILRNIIDDDTHTYEWDAKGVVSQTDNENLKKSIFKKLGLGRWEKILARGRIIQSLVEDLPKSERKILSSMKVVSVLVVPVFVKGKWWGAIGFDDCKSERKWLAADIGVLKSAANIIGVAIERDNSIQQFKQLYQDMDRFNQLMVGRELKMIELKEKIEKFKKRSIR